MPEHDDPTFVPDLRPSGGKWRIFVAVPLLSIALLALLSALSFQGDLAPVRYMLCLLAALTGVPAALLLIPVRLPRSPSGDAGRKMGRLGWVLVGVGTTLLLVLLFFAVPF